SIVSSRRCSSMTLDVSLLERLSTIFSGPSTLSAKLDSSTPRYSSSHLFASSTTKDLGEFLFISSDLLKLSRQRFSSEPSEVSSAFKAVFDLSLLDLPFLGRRYS
ncbi:hypothetical protein PENTCL1PPCAC_1868, partial [Pristionchus entomophagus]